jgi:D-glycero-alpha-D-manno-heptose 1-phosphate guanylyltransferase
MKPFIEKGNYLSPVTRHQSLVTPSMEAIVLAGGMGTRLQPLVEDVAKCMAPVAGKPFLEYLLNLLETAGFTHVILALGYKHETVETWLASYDSSMKITVSVEDTPLGTGGAVKMALSQAKQDIVFVFNGDTYFELDYGAFLQHHVEKKARASIALKQMYQFDRYGKVEINDDARIVCFAEKQYNDSGFINGGVYILNRDALENFTGKFSLEKDFFEPEVNTGKLAGFPSNGYFIDIGIPEDYLRAQNDFFSI